MSTTVVKTSLAISTSSRWPYYTTRILGPRSSAQPGELVVPLELKIDSALLRRQTSIVNINIPTPDNPTAEVRP